MARFGRMGGIVLLLLMVLSMGEARGEPVDSTAKSTEEPLALIADLIQFEAEKGMYYVEVNYQIPTSELVYTEKDNMFVAALESEVTYEDIVSDRKVTIDWEDKSVVRSREEAKKPGSAVLDQFGQILPPGRYQIDLKVMDSVSGKIGRFMRQVDLPDITDSLSLSDLLLSTGITPDTTGGKFVKSGYRVEPSPGRVFGGEEHFALYSYAEIYRLGYSEEEERTYSVTYHVLGQGDSLFGEYPPRVHTMPGPSAVEVQAVNVAGYPEGTYRLRLTVEDLWSQQVASAEQEFTVVRRKPTPMEIPIPDYVKPYYDKIEYIGSPQDIKLYESLSDVGKKEYLKKFWARRDPDPDTPQNELLLEFASRMKSADDQFTSGFEKGSESDRGRIYIRYGPPDEIKRYPADIFFPPFIIWRYHRGRAAEFAFSDDMSAGRYRLVYSSLPDHPSEPSWKKLIDAEKLELPWK
jgi:GWxTD domain-containing protein